MKKIILFLLLFFGLSSTVFGFTFNDGNFYTAKSGNAQVNLYKDDGTYISNCNVGTFGSPAITNWTNYVTYLDNGNIVILFYIKNIQLSNSQWFTKARGDCYIEISSTGSYISGGGTSSYTNAPGYTPLIEYDSNGRLIFQSVAYSNKYVIDPVSFTPYDRFDSFIFTNSAYNRASGNFEDLSNFSIPCTGPSDTCSCTSKLLNYSYNSGLNLSTDFNVNDSHISGEDTIFNYQNNDTRIVAFRNLTLNPTPIDYGSSTGNLQNINSSSGLTVTTKGYISSPIDYTSFQGFYLEDDLQNIGYIKINSNEDFTFYLYDTSSYLNEFKISGTKYNTNEYVYLEGTDINNLGIGLDVGAFELDYNITDVEFGEIIPQFIDSQVCTDISTGIIYVDGQETSSGELDILQDFVNQNDLTIPQGDDLIETIKIRIDTYMSLFSLNFSTTSNTFSLYLPTGSNNLAFEEHSLEISTEAYTPVNVVNLGTSQTSNSNYGLIVYLFGLIFVAFYMFIMFFLIKHVIFGFILFFLSLLFKFIKLISFNFFGNSFENKASGGLVSLPLLFIFFGLFLVVFDYFLGGYFNLFVDVFSGIRNILGNILNFFFLTFFNSTFFSDSIYYLDLAFKPLIIALFVFLVTKKYSNLV